MINLENLVFEKYDAAIWCGAEMDATELARAASVAIENKLSTVSVTPAGVGVIWPWVENRGIEILSRFYVNDASEVTVSAVTQNINSAFKNGADGAQVFVAPDDVDAFVSQVYVIRDDLFFNKKLFIGMDIGKINPLDWDGVFGAIKKIRADGVTLVLAHDAGDKSDFVGRVYAAANAWDMKNMSLQFVVGNLPNRIEQASRLFNSVLGDAAPKLKFFINI